MKVLLSWLRDFAPIETDPEELGLLLGDLGMAVEEMEVLDEGLDGIVVARVLDLRPHPGADKIQLVDVEAGDGEALQICCGAFNMSVGDLVPLATLGTTMPNGMEIARRKLRGEWSNGMLCAPDEIGLPGGHDGILVLPENLEPGTALTEALGVAGDVLYDLEINANRPDAMSVAGVARDVAARLGLPFSLPSPTVPRSGTPSTDVVTVEIVDPDRCGRFTARVLRGVTVGPSDPLIASRLTLLGMRPINNVVDASNYLMLELGQPSHPYDLATLGGGGFRIRLAQPDERITTLDDVSRTLTAEDLLICDATDVPVGIAGIMGGADTEISEATTDVVVEMAPGSSACPSPSRADDSACGRRRRRASSVASTPRASTWPRTASWSCSAAWTDRRSARPPTGWSTSGASCPTAVPSRCGPLGSTRSSARTWRRAR